VNDGSPSGFTLDGKLSTATDPFGNQPCFHPYRRSSEAWNSDLVHEAKGFSCPEEYRQLFVHPDAVQPLSADGFSCIEDRAFDFIPTSSGRTCRVLGDERGYFIKMSYPGTLGRVDRSMPDFKAIAGVEITEEIISAFEQDSLPTTTAILPEVAAVIARSPTHPAKTACHVVRPYATFPSSSQAGARLPLFSLWSRDRRAPEDPTLLAQIGAEDGELALRLVWDISSALIDFYLGLWRSRGLSYEVNAQNVLVELDNGRKLVRVVMRDFNSTEKDVAQRDQLALPTVFTSDEYKVLPAADSSYRMLRHSFAFDFKLCHYAISPMLSELDRCSVSGREDLLSRLRRKTKLEMQRLPDNFFPPAGVWWAHPPVDLTKERPYIEMANPMLR